MVTTAADSSLGVVGVVDAVTARLRSQILDGEIRSGVPLTEAAVSQTFGVARQSAKAAIEQLVATGLLVRTAHRTARVVGIDPDTVRDVYRTRARLESAALRELAVTRTVPQAAVDANAEILAMPPGPDRATVDPDLRFHTALIDAVGSDRTARMYGSLLDEARLCMAHVQGRRLLDAAVIAAQHAEILDAVRAGDAEGAAQTLWNHLSSAEQRLIAALDDTQE